MIVLDIENIDSDKYKKLIRYILSCCDEVSFQFPGVDHTGEAMPDYAEYYERCDDFIKECVRHEAKCAVSKHYNGMKLGQYGRIVYVKPFDTLERMLLCNHLYDFLWSNGLPEDVCFYKGGRLRFFSCAHDEDFRVYNESEKDVSFLENGEYEYRIIKER